jgi:EamA domain-containing membrane protein RarD
MFLFAVDQPLTETQGWWLIAELGILTLIALVTFVAGRRRL